MVNSFIQQECCVLFHFSLYILQSVSRSSSLGSEDRRLEANDGEGRPGCPPPAAGLSASVPPGSSHEQGGGAALAPAPREHHRHLPGGGRPPAQPSPHVLHLALCKEERSVMKTLTEIEFFLENLSSFLSSRLHKLNVIKARPRIIVPDMLAVMMW